MLIERTVGKFDLFLNLSPKERLYGIFDGASVPDLSNLIQASSGPATCLFAGVLDPEVARAAPYLLELDVQSESIDRLLHEAWGNHWGILAHIPADIPFSSVRKHFRSFLRAKLPDGRYVLFRYYDPRVLRQYLPTCTDGEASVIFGPVSAYFVEDSSTGSVTRFAPSNDVITPAAGMSA